MMALHRRLPHEGLLQRIGDRYGNILTRRLPLPVRSGTTSSSPRLRRCLPLRLLAALLVILILWAGIVFDFSFRDAMASTHLVQPISISATLPNHRGGSPTEALTLPPIRSPFPSERFISYLPHSGFHNQRISLENALTLAYTLNRTLIIPPVRLGSSMRYLPSTRLRTLQAQNNKAGMRHCSISIVDSSLPECSGYGGWTLVPWSWLVDLESIVNVLGIRVIELFETAESWMQGQMEFTENNTWVLDDMSVYQYRFVDDRPSTPGEKHAFSETKTFVNATLIGLKGLLTRTERHLAFGSLFGSSRLWLRNETLQQARRTIRTHMVFANPQLLDVADNIGKTLGGRYLGAHVRVGDGIFAEHADKNARLIWWKLLLTLGLSDRDIRELETTMIPMETRAPPTLSHPIASPSQSPTVFNTLSDICSREANATTKYTSLNFPLYIATDAHNPENHPSLRRFRSVFPCIYFLNSFTSSDSSKRSASSALDELINDYDGLPLRPFLFPFVEALVVSRSDVFVGTVGSTFSQFVSDVLSRVWRGENITERG